MVNGSDANVLISSMCIPGTADGGSLTAKALLQAIRRNGVRVSLCSSDYGHKDRTDIDPDIHLFHQTFARPMDFSIGVCRFLWKQVRRSSVCHFCAFYATATVWGAYLARFFGVPYVVSPMGNTVPLVRRDGRRKPGNLKKRLFFELVGKPILRGAACVVCTTEMERERIQKYLPDARCAVVPLGHEPLDESVGERALDLPQHSGVALFLGRLSPEKSIPFLLNVWAEVVKGVPGALLVIAGDDRLCPGYADALRARVSELDLDGAVHFAGTVDKNSKKWLFDKATCLVLPSVSENFGHVVVEALSAGRPVITSTGTPWKKLQEDGVGQWLPLERDIWVDLLTDYLANGRPTDHPEYARRCRQWVRDNIPTWDVAAHAQIEVYREVIERARCS